MEPLYSLNDLYVTIQGEGARSGTPVVLVRLQGCRVGCRFCDTKETWDLDPAAMSPAIVPDPERLERVLGTGPAWGWFDAVTIADAVLDAIRARSGAAMIRWVLLTGGEPADQPLAPLVSLLHELGFRVMLETSGTSMGYFGAGIDHLTVSPKVGMSGGLVVQARAIMDADEIRMPVGHPGDLEMLEVLLRTHRPGWRLDPDLRVLVSPISHSPKAMALCVNAAITKGYGVSCQTHRLMGIR